MVDQPKQAEPPQILLVDDDDMVRGFIQQGLQGEGYVVDSVSNAAEAFETFQAKLYDIVVSDIRMRDIDGLELLKRIKEIQNIQKNRKNIPIIMITGAPTVDSAQACLKAGAYDYLVKPFGKKDLMNTLNRAYQQKQIADRLDAYRNELEFRDKEQSNMISEIYRFANELNSLENLSAVLNFIVHFVAKQMESQRVSIMLLDDQNEWLRIVASLGLDPEVVRTTRIRRGEPIAGRVLAEGRAIRIDNISDIKGTGQQFSQSKSFVSFPLIQVSLRNQSTPIGIINVTDRKNDQSYSNSDLRNLDYIANIASVAISNQNKEILLQESYFATIRTLVLALDAKDRYTAGHSESVQKYSLAIAKQMGLNENEMSIISRASVLHDIGKIGIPDQIISKPNRLTPEEFNKVKQHPVIGEQMLKPIPFHGDIRKIIRHHHERYDGQGYPDGLSGQAIELGARIMAVADTFDAMTSDRPYRKGMSATKAVDELLRCRDSQFEPVVVDAFIEWLERELLKNK